MRLRIVPGTRVSGGRIRPGSRIVSVMSRSRFGIRKHATIPVPEWLWRRLGGVR